MKNWITYLEIKNFKSLKHVKMQCKRINLFIGRPNVGKSNLLEALSLYCGGYSRFNHPVLGDYIRYKDLDELFYDNEIGNPIEIDSNIGFATLRYHFNINYYDFILAGNKTVLKHTVPNRRLVDIKEDFDKFKQDKRNYNLPIKPDYFQLEPNGNFNSHDRSLNSPQTPVKKYDFKKEVTNYPNRFHWFLLSPFGENLFTLVQTNKSLYKEIATLFKEYKFNFTLDKKTLDFRLQKIISGVVISHPYSNIAETLRRYIFYLMAIETNKESILLFEEPEAHCFPPYIQQMSQRIIESKTNQYFITTHSPFVLNTIIENAKKGDVAIFTTSYKNFQTHITPLTNKELEDMLNYGYDIFSKLK